MCLCPLKGTLRWAKQAEVGLPVCSPRWKLWDLPQGVCMGLQVLLSSHPSAVLWAVVLMGKGCSPAGCGPARGAPWLQSWRAASWQRGNDGGHLEKHLLEKGLLFYFSKIFQDLLVFRVLGSFSFSFRRLLCLGIQATVVKFKWKVPVPIWGFSNKKVKWFICPFYLSKVVQYIFTEVSYFMLEENTCDFVNATFGVNSAAPWKGTYILLIVGSSCTCFLVFSLSEGACSYRNEWELSHWKLEGWEEQCKAATLGVLSGQSFWCKASHFTLVKILLHKMPFGESGEFWIQNDDKKHISSLWLSLEIVGPERLSLEVL